MVLYEYKTQENIKFFQKKCFLNFLWIFHKFIFFNNNLLLTCIHVNNNMYTCSRDCNGHPQKILQPYLQAFLNFEYFYSSTFSWSNLNIFTRILFSLSCLFWGPLHSNILANDIKRLNNGILCWCLGEKIIHEDRMRTDW